MDFWRYFRHPELDSDWWSFVQEYLIINHIPSEYQHRDILLS